MAKQTIRHTLAVEGMTCAGCERRIARALGNIPGVASAEASYASGAVALRYDSEMIDLPAIEQAITALGYRVAPAGDMRGGASAALQAAGTLVVLLALFLLLRRFGALNVFNAFPMAQAGMGLGMAFVIGLLTSLHCVAMCGGINLSQCVSSRCAGAGKLGTLRASLLYNLGRVCSYTAIGALVGAIGSVVSFSGAARGAVQLAAGGFMVVMGLNMLGIFPWLRRLTPRMPKLFTPKAGGPKGGNSPLYVGLLNGLMPCGPLQAMQLYALSTGSAAMGAVSMLLFSLGTVPLMFGLGALSSFLGGKFTRRMTLVSAVLVAVLGVSMFQSGMALSGFGAASAVAAQPTAPQPEGDAQPVDVEPAIAGDVQRVTTQLSRNRYAPITVEAGRPVQWIIQAEAANINGCNNEIIIPSLNITKKLEPGDNLIEFTPTQAGVIPFSCWMGMIRSTITVVEPEDGSPIEPAEAPFGPPAPAVDSLAGYLTPTDSGVVSGGSCCQ